MRRKFSPTVGTQLGLAFACVIALLGGVEVYTWSTLGRSLAESRSLFEDRLLPVVQIHQVREAYVSTLVWEARAVATGRANGVEAAERMAEARAHARTQWEAYKRTYLVADEARLVPRVDAQLASIAPIADRLQRLTKAHRQGDAALNTWLDAEYVPASGQLLDSLRLLVRIQEREGRALIHHLGTQERRAVALGGTILAISVGLAVLLAYRISRSLGRRSTSLVRRLEALAAGAGQKAVVEEDGGDWGRMARDLDRIVERLQAHSAATESLERKARAASEALATQNQALADAISKLREVHTLKANFTAMLAHDLRSPLTSMGFVIDAIREGVPLQGATLARAEQAYERVRSLLDEMLELYSSDQTDISVRASELDPSPWLRSLGSLFAERAAARGITFEQRVPESLPLLRGEREKLDRVFHNLLDNAIKFTVTGGVVRLEASVAHGSEIEAGLRFLRVCVSDTGRGIPPERLPFIFDPFRQVETRDAAQGFGLGLAIVQRLVAAHRGQIHVQSQVGSGTSFTVLLPC